MSRWTSCFAIILGSHLSCFGQQPTSTSVAASSAVRQFVDYHCLDCHNQEDAAAGLPLDQISHGEVARHTETWERVVRKLRARQMPPLDTPRPDERTYDTIVAELEKSLDNIAAVHPRPGRTATFRRLNRTEYGHAIRDLLALEIDVSALLPADEASHGFDNVTVSDLSPTLLNRYISAAQKISRLAVGSPLRTPGGDTIRIPADLTQEEHLAGLPLGTRGGVLIRYTFPRDGEYDVQLRLARDRNEEVEGLTEPHELEVLLDRERVQLFRVQPPAEGQGHDAIDAGLKVRFTVTAGPHDLGVTFLKQPSSLLETRRQPYQAHFNMHRHPRQAPAIYQVSITGPFSSTSAGDTPSRRRIFICRPTQRHEEEACARHILQVLMRRAYRRPVTDGDLNKPMEFYHVARQEGDFDAGIEAALSAVLVSPHFLFRIEADPAEAAPNTAYRISDLELASRLSFFLWSSIPDDALLEAAVRGDLRQPQVLEAHVRRMLADDRAETLVSNFAAQWLYLRNLDSFTPDLRLFPDFDDNLRQAFRRETELFVESIVREDRSVLDLLRANYTFLNERLAKHYGLPHIQGSRFRRVTLEGGGVRGGLLRQGSILTVTSYANRTSPVIRGHWILKNLLGAPPPPPPANVPALKENTVSATLSIRERLAEHRTNAACASCHNLMDPVGFALENFDAVGRWRDFDDGQAIDASGHFPDGSPFSGPAALEDVILSRPEMFVGTLVERLLTYALGRGVEPDDGPAIRGIIRDAREADFRFSSVVLGIVQSVPFQMRTTR